MCSNQCDITTKINEQIYNVAHKHNTPNKQPRDRKKPTLWKPRRDVFFRTDDMKIYVTSTQVCVCVRDGSLSHRVRATPTAILVCVCVYVCCLCVWVACVVSPLPFEAHFGWSRLDLSWSKTHIHTHTHLKNKHRQRELSVIYKTPYPKNNNMSLYKYDDEYYADKHIYTPYIYILSYTHTDTTHTHRKHT